MTGAAMTGPSTTDPATADPAIAVRALVKDYGATRALDGLDLEVRRGEVFGFLGPNGAGKSTTLRVLLDVLRPTSGRVEVLGADPRTGGAALRARIGYLPGELALTSRAGTGQLLEAISRLRGGVGRAAIGPLAERLGLDLTRPARSLSKGNRQKVGLVQAFAHDPELLVLDEPTSGLDPLLQQEFLAMVREARERGATVLMSSHVLSEVQEVADRVAVVRAGRIVDVDDVATLRQRAGQRVELTFADPVGAAAFEHLAGVEDVTLGPAGAGTRLTCLLRGEPDALLRAAAAHRVTRWSAQDRELEELFMDFYRDTTRDTTRETAGEVGGRAR